MGEHAQHQDHSPAITGEANEQPTGKPNQRQWLTSRMAMMGGNRNLVRDLPRHRNVTTASSRIDRSEMVLIQRVMRQQGSKASVSMLP